VGNFDHVIEETYSKCYLPFLGVLAEHPAIRLSLHYSGVLLEWISARHPDYLSKLRDLVERGQVELVGGGYYEPILPGIPDRDKAAQLQRLRDFLRRQFGAAPRGAWLAERVWEPSLARCLAEAGAEYIVLDDTHFLAAGLHSGDLGGYYMTDDAGFPLRLIPGLKTLRYTIPFRDPSETLSTLRQGLSASGAVLFASGDDCEKFGGWPGTFKHCYEDRWLERFFQALEQARDWLSMTTLSDYLDAQPPLGRIYLPTASYEEMMVWSLPLEAAREFEACLAESSRLPGAERFHRFLRGGIWRNFLAKYPEANQVHKLMIDVSDRIEAARASIPGPELSSVLAEAETHLFASQCNDAYWHGIFGGLYTPHLRAGILRHLIQAESLLDRIETGRQGSGLRARRSDFDCDGHEEILAGHPLFGLVLRPADGGTVSSLRFKPADIELINSLARRVETYHAEVQRTAAAEAAGGPPASIHELVRSKEPNLASYLRYDRYRRHVFRTFVFPASKQWWDYESLALGESAELAAGPWTLQASDLEAGSRGEGGDGLSFELSSTAALEAEGITSSIQAAKSVSTGTSGSTWQLECRSHFAVSAAGPAAPLAFGLELAFNLLAPHAPGRYFRAFSEAHDRMEPLGFRGELGGSKLLMVDEWQGVRISIAADPEPVWWIAPIETVSQSESGFERIYQGSAILAVWKPSLPIEGTFESRVRLEVEPERLRHL
jgi:4-alpha-glucanotransferase